MLKVSTALTALPEPQYKSAMFMLLCGEGWQRAGGEAEQVLEVFTTRPDTLCGATYMVVAPEHPLLAELTTGSQQEAVQAYVAAAAAKSDLERTELQKSKTGVSTGRVVIAVLGLMYNSGRWGPHKL